MNDYDISERRIHLCMFRISLEKNIKIFFIIQTETKRLD